MFEDIKPFIPSAQTILIIIAGLLIVAYIVIYFGGRMYNTRDGFTTSKEVIVEQDTGKPYATSPIMKLADYDDVTEIDVIAMQEGDRSANKEQLNKLASASQYDWSSLPPMSANFQEKQARWLLESKLTGSSTAANAVQFGSINTNTVEAFTGSQTAAQPPDYNTIAEEEAKLLATYVPEKSANLLKYSAEDVDDLITRVYKARGLIPEVKKAPSGVYEVVAVRPINEKVLYEDEVEEKLERESGNTPGVIEVPSAAEAVAAGLDPFYEPRTSMRPGRSTYMQWTPGLERSFAPTEDKLEWY